MIRIVNINGHIDFSNDNDLIEYANLHFHNTYDSNRNEWHVDTITNLRDALEFLEKECGWTYDTLTAYIWGNRKDKSSKDEPSNEKLWQIWAEGYLISGMEGVPSPAFLMGSAVAPTFKEACDKFFKNYPGADINYDSERLSYWACSLFDNEQDARKSFG